MVQVEAMFGLHHFFNFRMKPKDYRRNYYERYDKNSRLVSKHEIWMIECITFRSGQRNSIIFRLQADILNGKGNQYEENICHNIRTARRR